jgi:mRNA interferase HigB
MRIIAKKAIVLYYTEHNDAKTALEEWYEKTENAEWENFAQVKLTFNSADAVGNGRIVFNIKGNRYRLVALVLFRIKMVYIRFIGTHDEYEQITAIESI